MLFCSSPISSANRSSDDPGNQQRSQDIACMHACMGDEDVSERKKIDCVKEETLVTRAYIPLKREGSESGGQQMRDEPTCRSRYPMQE